jgi:hypothetical protein
MPTMQIFLWGAAGSLAVEIARLYSAVERPQGCMPARFKTVAFWVVRAFLTAVGGALAVAYEAQSAILAMNIGASAPLIISALASGPKRTQ